MLTRITAPGALYLGLVSLIPLDRAGPRRRQPELPVRWHLDPHRRRRRPGDGEADRVPAAAAALRRVPAVMRTSGHPRPARRRQGHAGRPHRRARSASRRSPPATSSAPTSRTSTALGLQVKEILDVRRLRAGRDHQRHGARPAVRGRRRRRASCSTATRAPRPRSRRSTRSWPSTATRSTRSSSSPSTTRPSSPRLLKRAEIEGREDDTEEVIRERQAIYAERPPR